MYLVSFGPAIPQLTLVLVKHAVLWRQDTDLFPTVHQSREILHIASIAGVYEHIRNHAPDPTSELSRSPTKFISINNHDNEALSNFNLGNATAFMGQTAHLHCALENLGDRTVSQTNKSTCFQRGQNGHVSKQTVVCEDKCADFLLQAIKVKYWTYGKSPLFISSSVTSVSLCP